jgi:hypothetical protein
MTGASLGNPIGMTGINRTANITPNPLIAINPKKRQQGSLFKRTSYGIHIGVQKRNVPGTPIGRINQMIPDGHRQQALAFR